MLRSNLSASRGFEVIGRRAKAALPPQYLTVNRYHFGKHKAKNLWGVAPVKSYDIRVLDFARIFTLSHRFITTNNYFMSVMDDTITNGIRYRDFADFFVPRADFKL